MGNSTACPATFDARTCKPAFRDRVMRSYRLQLLDLTSQKPSKPFKTNPASFKASESVHIARHQSDEMEATAMSKWPMSAHVRISYIMNGSACESSGTLIGPQFVLVLSSIVYNRVLKKEVDKDSIRLEVGNEDFKSRVRVLEVYYGAKYAEDGEDGFALLVLNKKVGRYTGSYGIMAMSTEEISGKSVSIHEVKDFWECSSIIEGVMIINRSAICYHNDGRYFIVGLYRRDSHSSSYRYREIYLNSSNIFTIQSWIRDFYMKYNIMSTLDLSLFPYTVIDILTHQISLGNLKHLTHLNLRGNSLGPKGAKELAKIEFKNLKSLNLTGNEIGSIGIKHLTKGKLGKLTHLSLGDNNIRSAGIRSLVRGNLINLEYLDLSDNQIGNNGALELAQGYLGKLTSLNLRGNEIGLSGAKALAKGELLNLVYLNLEENRKGHKGPLLLYQGKLNSLSGSNLTCEGLSFERTGGISQEKLRHNTILQQGDNSSDSPQKELFTKGLIIFSSDV